MDIPGLLACTHVFGPCSEDTFFGNAVCELFQEPIDKNDTGPPMTLAVHVLDQYSALEKHEAVLLAMSEHAVAATDMALTASRAIIAVSSPVPGLLGSSYDDAVRAFHPSAQDMQDEGNTKVAQENYDHLRTAANKNPHWRARLNAYLTTGLQDKSIAGKYHELVRELSSGDVGQIPLDKVEKAIESCQEWLPKLREGGCKLVVDKLIEWLGSIEATVRSGSLQGDGKKILEIAVRCVDFLDPRTRNQG